MKLYIDVHAHIFCAKDIPLKGYLLSRKYEEKVQKWLAPLFIPAVANCIRKKAEKSDRLIFRLIYTIVMKLVGSCMGKPYVEWGEALAKDIEAITCELVETFQPDAIELFVPLMIDYEYWFINTPDILLKEQIDNVYENIVVPYGGKIHPFVPFDPARELAFRKKLCNPDGRLERFGSLNLLRDAIENKGFIGVKLYNSLGYKPFNNTIVDAQRLNIPMHDKKYLFTGEEYDRVLAELYDYCVENEVPITAHCCMYGIESYNDASFDFGQAEFWREVLDQEKYKNLHLNLAHFGLYSEEGYDGEITWTKTICKMFNDYPNLFADVSCHRVTLKKYAQRFKNDYKLMCYEFPVVKERLMFGTDWHVLKRVPYYDSFKQSYVDVLSFENNFNEQDVDNFLGGNALRFLGLVKGGKNVRRLEKFYKTHDITPPEWFESL